MHADSLNGWLVYVIMGLVYVSLFGAVAILVDSMRRDRDDFGRLGRVPWIAIQAVYLVMGLLAIFLELGSAFAAATGTLFLVVLVQQVAYLLRVVFPSPARLAMREPAMSAVQNVSEEQ